MISAQIPEKIIYVCQESAPIEPKFNEVEESFFKTSAMPAFPVDAANEKTIETARSWATGWNRHRQDSSSEVHKEVVMDNTDIFEVQIVDLEIRDQGGRAYKAIVHGSFLVDIREDVMLEAMLVKGVRQGNFIASKFMWARIGAQMKLIRVGSSLHKAVVEANERRKLKKVSTKDLVPGKVYSNSNGYFLFLGFVRSASIQSEYKYHTTGLSIFNTSRSRSRGHYEAVSKEKPAKKQLWYKLYQNDIKLVETEEFDILKIKSDYQLDFTKSKTILPSTLPDVKLPKNHLTLLQQKMKNKDSVTSFELRTFAPYPSKELSLDPITQKQWDSVDYK